MTHKPVDLEAFYASRNQLASKELNKANMEAMDKVLKQVIEQRKARIQEEEARKSAPKAEKTK